MPKVIISDTSTLVLFHKIEEFNLLQKVYEELITTPEIAEEFGEVLPIGLKFKFTGVLGVINRAKQLSIIDKVKPLIDKLLLTDFRIANNIVEEILKLNNE